MPDPAPDAGGGGKNTEQEQGGGTTPPSGDKTPKTLTLTEDELQERLNAVAGRVREEEKKKADKAKADLQAEAERKAAEEKGNFQALYESEKKKREELETKTGVLDSYAKTINVHIDTEVKDWPASVKSTDPGPDDIDARMKWRESHRALAQQLGTLGNSPNLQHGRSGKQEESSSKTAASQYINQIYKRPDTAAK